MKHLNFLSKSSCQSCGHSSVTLASTVGSPSAHRRGIMLKLISVLVLVFTLGIGQMWGATMTYTHDFTTTFSNGDQTLSTITWTASGCTQMGSFNTANYKGVQFGTKKASGSFTLTSKYNWGAQTSTDYYGYTNVKKVYVWLNKGGGTTTASVTVGGTTATSDGTTVEKNSSASSQRTGTTKITFTPATGHNTGTIAITCSASGGAAGYICSIQVECEEPASSCSAPTSPSISGTTAYTVGQTISLTASATGVTNGTTTYQWYKGDPDNGGTSQGAASTSGATFTKANCVVGDAGTYYCVISNGTGCTAKTSKAITVAAAAVPSITPSVTQLDWGTVNKGTSLNTKTFTITGSNLTAANLVYTANGGYSVSPTGKDGAAGALASQTLTVTPPSTATPGTYNSTVTISGGGLASAVSVDVKLTVLNTDQFIDELHNTTGYTSANPHIEAGSYGTTPTIADKATATTGNCQALHYHFVGWITAAKYTAGTAIAAGDLQTPTSATGATYYAVWAKQAAGGTPEVSDVINASTTSEGIGSTASNQWAEFDITGSTGAVYRIRSMGTTNAAQWNTNGWLYCKTKPTGGAKLKSVTIVTTANKSINVYGSNSVYSEKPTSSATGSLSATSSGATYTFTSDYDCIALVGGTTGIGITSITITYKGTVSYTDYRAVCCTELAQINGSINLSHF